MFTRRSVLSFLPSMLLPQVAFSQSRLKIADINSHYGVFQHIQFKNDLIDNGIALKAMTIVPDHIYLTRMRNGEIRVTRQINSGDLFFAFDFMSKGLISRLASDKLLVLKNKEDLNLISNVNPGIVIAVEGADFIEGDFSRLEVAYQRGIRQIGIAHFVKSTLVDLRTEIPAIGGLSQDGFKFVEESQRLGIVVDMAHATDKAIDQACEVAKFPIVYSHGSIGRFKSSYRSSASEIMSISRATARKIAATGGMVGIWGARHNFSSLTNYGNELIKFVDWVGADHVGLGTDIGGLGAFDILNNSYSELRKVIDYLIAMNIPVDIVEKIAFGNYERVLRTVLKST